jgi:hypothetical protein
VPTIDVDRIREKDRDVRAESEAILRAGRMRRGEEKSTGYLPGTGAAARKILDAGRRRRGEIP